MDLSGFTTMAALMQDGRRWSQMPECLEAEEIPPKGARPPMTQARRGEPISGPEERDLPTSGLVGLKALVPGCRSVEIHRSPQSAFHFSEEFNRQRAYPFCELCAIQRSYLM